MYISEINDSENEMVFRNVALSVEWDYNIKTLMNSNDFFVELMRNEFGEWTETARTLSKGDLCMMPNTMSDSREAPGITDQGLLTVNNYLVSIIQSLRGAFDNTAKTFQDKQEIYSAPQFSHLERIYFGTRIPSYQLLANIAEEAFFSDISKFKEEILIMKIIQC